MHQEDRKRIAGDPTDSASRSDGERQAGTLASFSYLLYRPTEFFRIFARLETPTFTALAFWIYGIAAAIDRIDTELLKADLNSSRLSPLLALGDEWAFYWIYCLLGGLVGGVFFYALGGWWYKKRLLWSGAEDPDSDTARRVYVYASQLYAIPMIAYTVLETIWFESPLAAYESNEFSGLSLLMMLFWSVFVSYRGATTVFDLRKARARLWFLILPSAVYSMALIAVFSAFFLRESGPPQITDPREIETSSYSLSYPGNWSLDTADEDHDLNYDIEIGPAFDDALVNILMFDYEIDPEYLAKQTIANWEDAYIVSDTTTLYSWGEHTGYGVAGTLIIESAPYRALAFSALRPVPDSLYGSVVSGILVLELAEDDASERLQPGFDLIRDSFVLTGRIDN
jgi:hypothetical protein